MSFSEKGSLKKTPCRPPTSPSRPPRNAYARCRSRARVFRARLGFARTRARRCRDSHRRSSVRDSPRDVPRIIGRGFRPEVWSPPGAITRDSVARRGWKKWKIGPRGTSSSWGGRGRSWPAEKVRSAGRVTYRHVCRLCRSRPPAFARGAVALVRGHVRGLASAFVEGSFVVVSGASGGSVGGRLRSMSLSQSRDAPAGRRGRRRAGTAPSAGHGGREVAGIVCPVIGHACCVCRTVAWVGALRAW